MLKRLLNESQGKKPVVFMFSGQGVQFYQSDSFFIDAGARLYMPLNVSGAFHSFHMKDAMEEFSRFLEDFSFSKPDIPVISNAAAQPYTEQESTTHNHQKDEKMNIKGFSEWGVPFANKFIISGPCSAENEDQVMKTATALQKCGIHVFRAGIWKPRTRPGSFEGVGYKGLKWLQKVKEITGLPVTVEVADTDHIDACLKHDIDILWLGARTTVNPFSVQKIADALKGVDIPVMVKNSINPEMELWLGAIERLNRAGITKLAAIHRGFSSYKKNGYRNNPNWKIPIELRRRCPKLPMICDPSHICGNRELLSSVAQQAADLLFDGLMIESHIDPDSALSDAFQQVTPGQLQELLKGIVYKKEFVDEEQFLNDVEGLRRQIDEIDEQIIGLMGRRMEVASEIGRHKEVYSVAALQPERWKEVIQTRIKSGVEHQLSEEFILRCYQYIHEEAIRHQGKNKGI